MYTPNILLCTTKKRIGMVSKDVIEQWNIPQHYNKDIVIYDDKILYCDKHKKQYNKKASFNRTMSSLEEIINNPDYVYYDPDKQGLEYYKILDEPVVVIVRTASCKELKVRSVYPVFEDKIKYRKEKEEERKNHIKIN